MFTKQWFAHIQNDVYLKGTIELEGMLFHETIKGLMAFVSSIQNKKTPINSEETEKYLGPFLNKLDFLKENSLRHQSLRQTFKNSDPQELVQNKEFNHYSNELLQKVKQLNPHDPLNNSFLIAGGWLNSDGGHAMIYEFKKDEKGDLLFLIYNSGAGLNFHHKIQGLDKERFCPVYAYKILKEDLAEDRLQWFLGELLLPQLQLKDQAPYSAERLYEELFPKISYLKGELVDPFQYTRLDNITAGQHSGTCAEKALHQLIENSLPDKKSYQQFMYYFKKFALEHYVLGVEEKQEFDQPGVLNQIQVAIENMSRLLLKADYFDEDIRKNELDFLTPIKNKLNHYQELLAEESAPYLALQPELDKKENELINLECLKAANKPKFMLHNEEKGSSQLNLPLSFNFQAQELNSELREFKNQIELLLTKDPQTALQSLESLFLSWPMPPEPQCKLMEECLDSLEKKREFIESINNLNFLYSREYQKQHNKSIKPEFMVSQLSYMAMATHMKDILFPAPVSLLNILSMGLAESLNKIEASPYLGSENPATDARLAQIKTVLKPQYPSTMRKDYSCWQPAKDIKKYYDDILQQHGLRELFNKYYEPYCETHSILTNEKVCDRDEDDVRSLFLMKHYIESDPNQQKQFIEALSAYEKLSSEQTEDLTKKLDAALSEFVFQNSFEKSLQGNWSPMRSNPMEEKGPNVIELDNRGYSPEPVSSPLVNATRRNDLVTPTTWSLPENSLIDLILSHFQQDPNQIQICDFIPKKWAKTKDIKWIRELLHLRSSALLLPATADFFARNLSLFEDEEKQLYLEKNLFDSTLLIKALDKEPEVIDQVQQFLEMGKQAYSKSGILNKPVLFFMKLDVKLCLYSLEYYQLKLRQLEKGSSDYSATQQIIKRLNESRMEKLTQLNRLFELHQDVPQVLHQLAIQKNLLLSSLMRDASSLKEKKALFQPLMASLLAMRYYERKSNVENLLEKEKLEQGFRLLQVTFDAMAKVDKLAADQIMIQGIKDTLASLGTDFKKMMQVDSLELHLNMPFVLLSSKGQELLTINFNQGSILKPGLNNCYLPDELRNKDWYLSLFKEYDPIARSNHDNSYFEFEYQKKSYRIIKVNQDYVLQKQIQVLEPDASWYQAASLNDIGGLQSIFKEEDHTAWVKVQADYLERKAEQGEQILIEETKSAKPKYYYQGASHQLIQLDEKALETGFSALEQHSFLHQMLSHFEDPEFIKVFKGSEGYSIELPRYNLNLEVKKTTLEEQKADDSKWKVLLAGTKYHLDFKEHNSLIPGLKAPLVFKADKETKVFLPMQQFLVEDDLKVQNTRENKRVYAAGNTGPDLIEPSSWNDKTSILEAPSKRFDKKSITPTPQEDKEPILEDPSKRFDKKAKTPITQEDKEPILEDPSKRFDKKAKISTPQEDKEPILEAPSRQLEKNPESTIHQIQEETKLILDDSKSLGPKKTYKERSEYYNFILDTSDHIKRDLVGNKSLSHKYSGSEGLAECVLKDGQLLPKSMKDGLYLAYTYLCCHQTQKAFDMLDYCEKHFHELSGSAEELDTLKWMIFSTPAQLKKSTVAPKIETPEFLAVKLKAMYLLANFKNHNPDFTVQKDNAAISNSEERLYQAKMQSQRETFYKGLSGNIYALYHKYQHVKGNIPSSLLLENKELLTLLRTVYGGKNIKAKGPIGAQWRQLEALQLHTELRILEEKAKCFTQGAPQQLLQDIALVKIKLAKNKPVGAERSIIKEQALSVDIPEQFTWNFDFLKVKDIEGLNQLYQQKNQTPSSKTTPLDKLLSFPIDETQYVLHFPSLCDAIYDNTLNETARNRILEFCEQSIKANSKNKDNFKSLFLSDSKNESKSNNLLVLNQFLYVLIKEREALRTLVKKSQDQNSDEPELKFQYSYEIKNLNVWMDNLHSLLLKVPTKSTVMIKEVATAVGGIEEKPLTTLKILAEKLEKTVKPHVPVSLKFFEDKATQIPEEKEKTTRAPLEFLESPSPINEALIASYKEMAVLKEQYGVKNLLSKDDNELSFFYKEITRLTKKYEAQITSLKKEYLEANTIDDFISRTQRTTELDNQAGSLTHALEQDKAQCALHAFEIYDKRQSIFNKVKQAETQLESSCATKLKQLEDYANQNFVTQPKGAAQVDLQLKLLGRALVRLKLPELLQLYLNNDLNQTVIASGLSEEQAKILHDKITEYLAFAIQKQQYSRMVRIFKDFVDDKSPINSQSNLLAQQVLTKLGQALTEENVLPFGQSPALTLFQYDQDILVRGVQKQFIESLLERDPKIKIFSNKLIQLIMGGGKSKVLLPILALQKADGENLSVIEVPEALFKTNLADLNQISLRLFNQHAFGFHFTRQSSCDPITLKQLYRTLKQTSVNKGYVVTTKESMASLDLKYHELLSLPSGKRDAHWEKQIKWLDRIINFRKTRADVLIDEMDSSLSIRKQINYTVGDKSQVPINHLNLVVELYEFLNQIEYEKSFLLDVLLKTDALSDDLLNKLLGMVALELIHNKQSPLFPYLPEPLDEKEAKNLVNYLLNKSKTYPQTVQEQETASGKLAFKLMKGELSHFLPHSLALKLFTHYGPSNNPEKSLLERLITIPYGGNNDPQERSKDTIHIKTLNLSIQSILTQGLSVEMLEFILSEVIQNAKTELLNHPHLGTIDNTYYGKNINQALQKAGIQLPVSKINLKDPVEMLKLTESLKNNRMFLFYALQEYILPKLEIDTKILIHTPLNHIDMYRSAQGTTGTPYNWRTMHQKIQFDELLSIGTDGLTSSRLRAKKSDQSFETAVHVLAYENPLQFIRNAVKKLSNPEKFRAVIDVGARFRGVSNKQVALDLASFAKEFNQSYKTSIEYVLYFDKDNITKMDELYALSVKDPSAASISLKGKTPKEIESLLQCNEEGYFTYYDQKHTLGTDIKQGLSAHALVTVDSKTLKKDLCQGVMRMRGFGNGQTVSVVISQETCEAIGVDEKDVNIEQVIHLSDSNQNAVLLQDHFTAALQMMHNTIVNDLEKRIQAVDDKNAVKKAELHQHFESFFTQTLSELFIDYYGAIEQKQPTTTLLKNHRKKLIKDWLEVLQKASIYPTPEELNSIKSSLKDIQNMALRNCNDQYLKSEQDQNQSSESQKEMHNKPEANQKGNLEVDESFYEVVHRSTDPLYWTMKMTLKELINLKPDDIFETSYWDSTKNKQYTINKTSSMPQLVRNPREFQAENQLPYITSNFDPRIRISSNVTKTTNFDEQNYIISKLQKQIHTVLMIQKADELQCILITFKEAEHIKELLKINKPEPPNYIWIASTHDTLYAGIKPGKEQLNKQYDRLIQQVRFYNGDFDLLNRSDLSGTWLMEESQEKLQYFEDQLFSIRLTDKLALNQLKKKTNQLTQAFQEVITSSDKSFKSLDIKHRFPLINPSDLESLSTFHHFCQTLSSVEARPIAEEYTQAFYFKLFLNCSDDHLFNSYMQRLDKDILKKLLIETIELVEASRQFGRISVLFTRPPFNTEEKQAILLHALEQSMERKTFTNNLLIFSSDEELKLFLGHLTSPLKQKLLYSMSAEQFTNFVARDLSVIKALCDDLGAEALNDKAPNLNTYGELIKDSKDGRVSNSFDYLFKNSDKFQYLQSHATREYLKAFWNRTERGVEPLSEILTLLSTSENNEYFITLFNEAYAVVLDTTLWLEALGLSRSEKEWIIEPLLFLSERLSLASFFSALQKEPQYFLSMCTNEKNHQVIHFFYHQLMKLDSDKEITEVFRGIYGLAVILNRMENKPSVHEQLTVMDIKANLISEAENPRSYDIDTYLEKYSSEWLKRPDDLIPISQLRVDNSDSSSRLIVDIIQEQGNDSLIRKLNEILEKEKDISPSPKPKGYETNFFKSGLAMKPTRKHLNVEEKQENQP